MFIHLSDYDKSCKGAVQIIKVHAAVYLDDDRVGWKEHQLAEPEHDPVIVVDIKFMNINVTGNKWNLQTMLTAIYKPALDIFFFIDKVFPDAVNGTILYDILMRAIITYQDSLFDTSDRSIKELTQSEFANFSSWPNPNQSKDWQHACSKLVEDINKLAIDRLSMLTK